MVQRDGSSRDDLEFNMKDRIIHRGLISQEYFIGGVSKLQTGNFINSQNNSFTLFFVFFQKCLSQSVLFIDSENFVRRK